MRIKVVIITTLLPLLLISISPLVEGEQQLIKYDDGEFESIQFWAPPPEEGYMQAVRFTPTKTPVKLLAAHIYIDEIPTSFIIRIFDANRNLLPHKIGVTPSNVGWVTADLSGLNIEMRGDFYVAVEGDPTARFSPMIGADTSNPDEGRSWWITPSVWISTSEVARLKNDPDFKADFGIRVVVALPHSLTIDSDPRVGSLVVDGTNYAATQLPLTFTWIQGSKHILHVPSEVIQVSESTRFVFVGWSDGSKENPRTVTVTKDMRLTALWKKQFLLTIVSEYGSPKGGGWYDEGTSATISIGTPVEISPGTRAVFRGWAVDVSSSETTIKIVMNSPKKVTALWKLQHLLTIDSGGGLVSGGGWYDAGSTASVKALTPHVLQEGVSRLVFVRWSGDMTSTSPNETVVMDRPKKITAEWKQQFRVVVDIDPLKAGPESENWLDKGSEVTLVARTPIMLAGERSQYVFVRWSDGQTGTHRSIIVDRGMELRAEYELQHLLDVVSAHGRTVGGGWYKHGNMAFFSILNSSVPAGFLIYYVFETWYGDYTGSSPSASIKMDGPKTVIAVWRTDYTILLIALVLPLVAGASGAAVYFARRKKETRQAIVEPPIPELQALEKMLKGWNNIC